MRQPKVSSRFSWFVFLLPTTDRASANVKGSVFKAHYRSVAPPTYFLWEILTRHIATHQTECHYKATSLCVRTFHCGVAGIYPKNTHVLWVSGLTRWGYGRGSMCLPHPRPPNETTGPPPREWNRPDPHCRPHRSIPSSRLTQSRSEAYPSTHSLATTIFADWTHSQPHAESSPSIDIFRTGNSLYRHQGDKCVSPNAMSCCHKHSTPIVAAATHGVTLISPMHSE